MKTLKHMFAALSAAVLAFCAAAAPASAQTSLELAPLEVRQDARAIPEYALGSDLSLYLPGDADLDGKVDGFDASLILMHFVMNFTCGWDLLTPDQIVVSNTDGESLPLRYYDGTAYYDTECPVCAMDATHVLRYFACHNAGIECTMEQIVNLEVEPPEK